MKPYSRFLEEENICAVVSVSPHYPPSDFEWYIMNNPAANKYYGGLVINKNNIIVADSSGTNPFKIHKSVDGGVSWLEKYADTILSSKRYPMLPTANYSGYGATCGKFLNMHGVLAFGYRDSTYVSPGVFYSVDDGETWARHTPNSNIDGRGSGIALLWLKSLDEMYGSCTEYFFKLTNAAQTIINKVNVGGWCIALLVNGTRLDGLFVKYFSPYLCAWKHSDDDGLTWEERGSVTIAGNPGDTLKSAHIFNEDTGIFYFNGNFYYTTNGGYEWHQVAATADGTTILWGDGVFLNSKNHVPTKYTNWGTTEEQQRMDQTPDAGGTVGLSFSTDLSCGIMICFQIISTGKCLYRSWTI